MIEVLKAVYDRLVTDEMLVALTGHTPAVRHIYRGFPSLPPKVPAVVFHISTTKRMTGPLTSPRELTVSFIVWAKTDAATDAIAERLMALLHNKASELSNTKVFFLTADWDDFAEGPFWDTEMEAWRQDIRFRFKAREA